MRIVVRLESYRLAVTARDLYEMTAIHQAPAHCPRKCFPRALRGRGNY